MYTVYFQNWMGCEKIETVETYEAAETKIEELEAQESYTSSEEGYCIWSETEQRWIY
jgi:hypothetical protein